MRKSGMNPQEMILETLDTLLLEIKFKEIKTDCKNKIEGTPVPTIQIDTDSKFGDGPTLDVLAHSYFITKEKGEQIDWKYPLVEHKILTTSV